MKRIRARCGVDFCSDCGDCLACYGGEECAISDYEHPTHVVVENHEAGDEEDCDEEDEDCADSEHTE